MKKSIETKLLTLKERYEELAALLSDSEIINNQNKFRDYSKEYASLEDIVQCFNHWQEVKSDYEQAQELSEDDSSDQEFKELIKQEIKDKNIELTNLEQELQILLLPQDPNDTRNVFLEIRAGTGGDEASIFTGDLARMYSKYGEKQGWNIEILSQNEGEHGGYKEIIMRVSGTAVYSQLKYESGTHRVQRVPTTESQGRIHTSACTVAILPEADNIEEIDINPADLRIDTFRASGAGGQHVNKTDSAIRITHNPTGIVVECQDERSQHKNRARAMSLLQAKILEIEQTKQKQEEAASRKSMVGSGDRSERIRTYNYPQGRVTDHRINLTLYKLEQIMEGELELVIEPLRQEDQAQKLAEYNDSE